jgi:molybdopterin converting factor small subunit
MAQLQLRWFAGLRERRGVDAELLEVEDGLTVGALYERLIPAPRVPVRCALNGQIVPGDAVVQDGELVFLPPVGGG